jgi:hypothetical protein
MTTHTTRSLSLHDVINEGVGGRNRIDEHLTSAMRESRGIKPMLPSTQRSIDGHLREAVDHVLDRDVVAVLGAGWLATHELREAARRTAATPDATELVEFLKLTISLTIRPSVRLYVDREMLMIVELEVVLDTAFRELTAAVSAGALVGIEFGECVVTVSIRASSGTQLVTRALPLTSNVRLRLPHPIALVTPVAR